MIQSYVIGLICCLLNLNTMDLKSDDYWVFFNAVGTCLLTPILFIFPIFGIIFMPCYISKLKDKDFRKKFGELYSGYNINNKSFIIYWGMDQLRKVLLVCVVCML